MIPPFVKVLPTTARKIGRVHVNDARHADEAQVMAHEKPYTEQNQQDADQNYDPWYHLEQETDSHGSKEAYKSRSHS